MAQTSPFAKTTIVSPGASATASGTNLLNAVSAASGSSTQPWLIKVEPGVYDLGSSRLTMKSWVDIEGSSIGTTFIEGDGPSGTSDAIVKGADDSEIRSLTIRCVGTTGCRGMINSSGATNLRDVHITADLSSGAITGIRNEGQSPKLDSVEINLKGGDDEIRGVANFTASSVDSKPTLDGTRILISNVDSTADASGVYSDSTSGLQKLENSQISVSGGDRAAAIFAANPATITAGRKHYAILDTDIYVTGGTSNYGILDSYWDIRVYRSRVRAFGSTSTGISTANGQVDVTNTEIQGETATVVADTANIGISRLSGGALSATTKSCGLIVDENYDHYPNTCP